jgi:hypothetical protein
MPVRETLTEQDLRLVIHPASQFGFPAANASDKKFNSRSLAPTSSGNEPFGKKVEERSRGVDEK